MSARGLRPLARALAVALAGAVGGGCASTQYTPRVVARGELTLRYDGGFEAWGGGRKVASGLTWIGLSDYVRCAPQAKEQADSARGSGVGAVVSSVLAGGLGVAALGGLYGLADERNQWTWLGAGLGAAAGGLVFGVLAQALKNSANGHAADAVNYYNDQVGSLGATCDDLVYPPSAGEAPPAPPPER